MAIIVWIILSVFAFPKPSSTQAKAGSSPFVMNLDYARFRNDATSGYLELYYLFYCGQLTFHRNGVNLRGAIVLNTDIIKEQTEEFLVKEGIVLPVVLEDTSGLVRSKSVVRLAGHILPMGKYLLHVVAHDSANPAMTDSLSLRFDVNEYSKSPAISDLELCSSIKTSKNTADPFFKNAHEVVPNPTLVFGNPYPVIYVYTELYGVDTSRHYVVEYVILNDGGTLVKKASRHRRYSVSNTVEVGTLNTISLKSGRYSLRFNLKDSLGGKSTLVEKKFYINNPSIAIEGAKLSSPSLASAVVALTDKEVDEEFLQAKYLANESEVYLFSQLTSQGKKEFLIDFWNRKEAGSESQPPRRRADYLRSVALASERFSTFVKRGWRTDRGRVFILYGNPDEVERHPSQGETKPFEIWYYYQIENGVQFIFVDRIGFSDYELVHSTKRGELQDEGWARFLR